MREHVTLQQATAAFFRRIYDFMPQSSTLLYYNAAAARGDDGGMQAAEGRVCGERWSRFLSSSTTQPPTTPTTHERGVARRKNKISF